MWGAGEGFVSGHLKTIYKNNISITGVDNNYDALKVARSLNSFDNIIQGDIYHLPLQNDSFDLVVCTEVLEHLRHVEKALEELKRVTRGHCLFSVPSENLLRLCRLLGFKNIRQLGKHPEHFQSFTKTSFCNTIRPVFKIEKVRTSFPWVIILCSK